MKTIGIVAEYNPFHNGHAYQIKKAKEITGADYAVIVMSGNFVQRGEPAIAPAHVRAQMALNAGADLVLELPIWAATGSAEYFSQGAIRMLNSLGCIDYLSFGCENPDLEELLYLGEFFENEPPAYKLSLKSNLESGMSFPAAREKALKEYIEALEASADENAFSDAADDAVGATAGDADADAELPPFGAEEIPHLLQNPNNILAVEYLRALKKYNSPIEPVPIERTDSGFHALVPDEETNLSSASALRALIRRSPNSWKKEIRRYIPADSFSALPENLWKADAHTKSAYDLLLHYKLMNDSYVSRYLDVSTELDRRIRNLLPMYRTADRFTSLLKTKEMTEARIRRALLHTCLEITSEEAEAFREDAIAPYGRILGFRKDAKELLHTIKNSTEMPLITKTADAKDILSRQAMHLFEKDIYAAHFYQLLNHENDEPIRSEYTRSPVII